MANVCVHVISNGFHALPSPFSNMGIQWDLTDLTFPLPLLSLSLLQKQALWPGGATIPFSVISYW